MLHRRTSEKIRSKNNQHSTQWDFKLQQNRSFMRISTRAQYTLSDRYNRNHTRTTRVHKNKTRKHPERLQYSILVHKFKSTQPKSDNKTSTK